MPLNTPFASWNEGGYNPLASWNRGVGADSFAARRQRLLGHLASNGARTPGFAGLQGIGAQGAPGMGGLAGTPALTYNPFLSMIAGRGNENFYGSPAGMDPAVAQSVQQGTGLPQPGGAPPNPIAGQPPSPGTTGGQGGITQDMSSWQASVNNSANAPRMMFGMNQPAAAPPPVSDPFRNFQLSRVR